MDQNRLSQLALHFIPGIGSFIIKQLISYSGSAENVFKRSKASLLKIPGVGPATAEAILNNRSFRKAEEELRRAERENVKLLLYADKDFPTRLNHINDAPSLLYYKGTANLNAQKVVAIVGTRNSTSYGKDFTTELIEGLKSHQPLIVSGLAYGIDIQAHRCSLKNNLPTVGVMASGVDIIYPLLHKETARQMTEQGGGLLTEHSFGTQPEPPRFPARNRIIAAMADAIIIIEAAKRGGALITAEIANGYNKDVFAVPGNIHGSFSEGCNNLIKTNKAHLLTGVKDLEYIMNWENEKAQIDSSEKIDISALDEEEVLVFTALKTHNKPIFIDNLSWQTQLSVSRLASVLLNLEFKGLVISLPGKSYKLVNKNGR